MNKHSYLDSYAGQKTYFNEDRRHNPINNSYSSADYRNQKSFSSPTDINLDSTGQTTTAAAGNGKIIKIVIAVALAVLVAGLVTFCILFFGVAFKSPGYKEACDSSKPCISGKNLTCNNTCVCDSSISFWDGQSCVPLVPFGSKCIGGNFQCGPSMMCKNQVCQCDNSSYYNGIKCVSKLGYGVSCTECNTSSICPTCDACLQCADPLYCNKTSSQCICSIATHYYDVTLGCTAKVGFGRYCTANTMCKDITDKMMCQTGTMGTTCPSQPSINNCNCPNTTYYNGSTCLAYELYGGACPTGCECDVSKGLFCDTANDLRCACPTNYYWTGSACAQQQLYLAACTSNSQCWGSKGLVCSSSKCQCGVYATNWYWSIANQECYECPTGWSIISYSTEQRCIKLSTDKQKWASAQLYCQSNGARLMNLNNTFLNDALKLLNWQTSINNYIWLGATDDKTENTFVWTYNSETVSLMNSICTGSYTGSTVYNCLTLFPTSTTWCWRDWQCETLYNYVCQKLQ